ncbi:hypothetical protein, partial [Glaesserella parasuis]|uniref:hypothetical protein n=1 Tax=Glaesserella parasuis TaxID=738 RepID=UPI003853AF7A
THHHSICIYAFSLSALSLNASNSFSLHRLVHFNPVHSNGFSLLISDFSENLRQYLRIDWQFGQ